MSTKYHGHGSASTHKPWKKPKIADERKALPKPKRKRDVTPGAKPILAPHVSSKGKGKEKETLSEKPTKSVDKLSPTSLLPSTFKIVAGSYEKLLYGLEGSTAYEESGLKFHLKPTFAFPAHVSCVKAVATSPDGGKWLATGSADEIIKVWDLRRRKELGGLMHHEGSITQLTFPSRSHLLSASEDGTLSLFHTRDWAVLRILKGHKGRVNSFAVHPSGKLALSVGKDKTLRMWDLMRGKGSASVKLGKEGEVVRWSTAGSSFIVQSQKTVDIYSTDMSLLCSVAHPSRIHDVKFCTDILGEEEVMLVAAEDKKVSVYALASVSQKETPSIIAEMVGHSNRVKAVDTMAVALSSSPSTTRQSTTVASTVSSDGKILVYDLGGSSRSPSSSKITQINPVAEYDTKGTRLTCLALAEGDISGDIKPKGKRKRTDDDDEGENNGDSDDEVAAEEDWGPQEIEEEEADDGSGSDSEQEDE